MYIVEIDSGLCSKCKQCMDGCPSGVFAAQDDEVVVVNMQECVGCEACTELCKEGAVTLTEI